MPAMRHIPRVFIVLGLLSLAAEAGCGGRSLLAPSLALPIECDAVTRRNPATPRRRTLGASDRGGLPWNALASARLLLVVVLGLVLAGCGGDERREAATPGATDSVQESLPENGGGTLNGVVGPGFDISQKGTDGLTAGSYTLSIEDKASAHNFHLTGPAASTWRPTSAKRAPRRSRSSSSPASTRSSATRTRAR